MNEYLQILKDLIWPIFYAFVLFFARKPLISIAKAIEERIAQGAPIEAGATGIKIGSVPRPNGNEPAARVAVAKKVGAHSSPKPGTVYLVHSAQRNRSLDKPGYKFYSVRIYLDADTQEELDKVKRVVYYLHDTFRNPIVESQSLEDNFEHRTSVWGEFNIAAKVYFQDGQSIQLERYLNL